MGPVATRHDKLAVHYLDTVHVAIITDWLITTSRTVKAPCGTRQGPSRVSGSRDPSPKIR